MKLPRVPAKASLLILYAQPRDVSASGLTVPSTYSVPRALIHRMPPGTGICWMLKSSWTSLSTIVPVASAASADPPSTVYVSVNVSSCSSSSSSTMPTEIVPTVSPAGIVSDWPGSST